MKKMPKRIKGKVNRRIKRNITKSNYLNSGFSLCDPNIIKELTLASEKEHQRWAKEMKKFLEMLDTVVLEAGCALNNYLVNRYRGRYRKLIKSGNIESLDPSVFLKRSTDNQINKTGSQILFERLKEYEDEIFTFEEYDTQQNDSS